MGTFPYIEKAITGIVKAVEERRKEREDIQRLIRRKRTNIMMSDE